MTEVVVAEVIVTKEEKIVDCTMSKIYKLYDKPSGNVFYIGSTTRELKERFREHLRGIRDLTNDRYSMARCYKIEDIGIALLELYPCDNLEELRKRETYYFKQHLGIGTRLMNKVMPSRSPKEWRNDNPDYQTEWKAKNPGYHQRWRQSHPGYGKEYYAANKDKILQQARLRRQKANNEPSG